MLTFENDCWREREINYVLQLKSGVMLRLYTRQPLPDEFQEAFSQHFSDLNLLSFLVHNLMVQ